MDADFLINGTRSKAPPWTALQARLCRAITAEAEPPAQRVPSQSLGTRRRLNLRKSASSAVPYLRPRPNLRPCLAATNATPNRKPARPMAIVSDMAKMAIASMLGLGGGSLGAEFPL